MTGKKGRSGPNGADTTNKRSETQRITDRAELAGLRRRGWTLQMISERWGVSINQVHEDWKITLRQLREVQTEDTKELVAEILEAYYHIYREADEAWERSKGDAVKVVEDRVLSQPFSPGEAAGAARNTKGNGNGSGKGKGKDKGSKGDGPKVSDAKEGGNVEKMKARITKTTEGRLPESEYLQIKIDCLTAIRELLALNPAKQLSVKGQVTTTNFNWDALTTLDPSQPIPDEVAQAMAAQLGYPRPLNPFDGSKKGQGLVIDETGAAIEPKDLTVEEARELVRQAGLLNQGESEPDKG